MSYEQELTPLREEAKTLLVAALKRKHSSRVLLDAIEKATGYKAVSSMPEDKLPAAIAVLKVFIKC